MSIKKNVFVSYTLQDRFLSFSLLKKFKDILESVCFSYIDILDNNSSENPQKRVYEELEKADYLFLIKTPKVKNSIWVNKEIEYALNKNIPIYCMDMNYVNKLLESECFEFNDIVSHCCLYNKN